MIQCTLAGVTFINWNEIDITLQDEIYVKQDEDFSDQEIALSVHLSTGVKIGYIPLLSTIQKWGEKAKENNDLESYKYNRDRYIYTKIIRDNIINDLFRNHTIVNGMISFIKADNETGEIKSIGVAFDYM
jgi:hypothetical protein